MSYAVFITRKAQSELESIPTPASQSIEVKLRSLGGDPRPHDCKKLRGTKNTWRIRAGDYRVIYQIEDAANTVTVIKIGHRSDVYR